LDLFQPKPGEVVKSLLILVVICFLFCLLILYLTFLDRIPFRCSQTNTLLVVCL